MKIIDVHTHLGDVLYPNGESVIEKGRTRMPWFDPLVIFERRRWRGIPGQRFLEKGVTRTSMLRSRAATRANMRASMDKHGISHVAVMSVPPAVTFADLRAAYRKDKTMLPFTSVDYSKVTNLTSKFATDVAQGARGLKLHPILQKVRLNDRRNYDVVEAFAPHGLPILFHAGVSEYYADPADQSRCVPAYGAIEDALPLMRAFPHVNFIVGHAGLDGRNAVMDLLSPLPNAYVDVSFQSAEHVRQLLRSFGTERVLFGSDWPWGSMDVSIRILEQVCDHAQLKRVLGENAAQLLKLSI